MASLLFALYSGGNKIDAKNFAFIWCIHFLDGEVKHKKLGFQKYKRKLEAKLKFN